MRRRKCYFEDAEGTPPPLELTVTHRICFSEVDALGIVWHGNYTKFFELAMTEMNFRVGLNSQAQVDAGIATPVAQIHFDYFRSLYLDEIIAITVKLHWSDSARLNAEVVIRNSRGETAVTGYLVEMFVELHTREPFWFAPPYWRECLEKWKNGAFSHEN